MSEIANGAAGAWSYRAGDWYAVFGSNAVIVLPASQRDQVVGLWALVDGGAGFDEVLDGLLASGLSRIPGFVLAGLDAGRFLLRGDGVVATLTTGTGDSADTVTVDGAESHTWVERAVEGVTALSISLPGAAGDASTAAAGTADFPIDTGLVRVGRIDRPAVAAAPTAAPAAPPAAAPVAGAHLAEEPEPAPVAEPEPEPAPVAEPAPFEEPSPLSEPVAFDDSPATEVMEAIPDEIRDPLTDPIGEAPSEPAPEGWVTPWDEPTGPPPSVPAPSVPAPSVPPPAMPPPPVLPPVPSDLPPAPSTPPPGWVPPPPPPPAEPEPAQPELQPELPEPQPEQHDAPLTVGSWEPVGSGFAPPDPIDHDGFTVVGGGEPPAPGVPGLGDQPAAPAGAQPVAKLLVSDGQSILVDRAVLIGRAPEARRFTSAEQPTLVTVPSRLHEISSTHVEVRPGTGADLGTAVVTDMGSTNGTVLVQPGLGPEDLKPGIAVQLIPGAIINLGDGVTIQVTRP